jgi:DNA repair exonuclease SbcCD ATPase subunit
LSTPILRFGFRGEEVIFELLPSTEHSPGIDERIAQIDLAKDSLESALSAVDELKAAAERNKDELRDALERIEQTRADKAAAEKELENVKQIAQADVEVFKKLAGVPSPAQIARERFIGFLVGVIASLTAWGILLILKRLWDQLKP